MAPLKSVGLDSAAESPANETAGFQENRERFDRNEMFVQLTIHDVPASLLKEFAQVIVKPYYPGGISPAIKDLMRKVVESEKKREKGQTS